MQRRKKLRIGVIFGGRSSEHEISLLSARNVIAALDPANYDIVPIAIAKDGRWRICGARETLLDADDPKRIAVNPASTRALALAPGTDGRALEAQGRGASPDKLALDVVFPVLHGTYGEDGSIQGLLRMLDLPFVGCDVLGSAVGMDKDVAKRLLRDAGIPVADFVTLGRGEAWSPVAIRRRLGKVVFVKPANQGSSVGVSKAKDEAGLRKAVREAFRFDDKILIEEAVVGREIECAVLGNARPRASVLGEIVPHHEFYSYEAKYLDEDGAGLRIPAPMPAALAREGRALALKAFRTLALEGMARVDFFLTPRGRFLVNEVNTIPGFTRISMYPKLWDATGLPYPKLVDGLIRLALERHARKRKLSTAA